jgi:hypothetical protein
VQVARKTQALVRCLGALALTLLAGTLVLSPVVAQDAPKKSSKPSDEGKAKKTEAKADAKKSEKQSDKKPEAKKADAKKDTKKADAKKSDAKKKAEEAKDETPDAQEGARPDVSDVANAPVSEEPKVIAADKLPKPIRALHLCAAAEDEVEYSEERYSKSVVFFVTCPAVTKGGLTPTVVYVARDAKAAGARRVKFELLTSEGTTKTEDIVFSAVPAREAYTEEGDLTPNTKVKMDTPWFSGAWRPDDRDGVCAVAANWKLDGDKAELWYWEEASDCPKNAVPKYQAKLDKKPPPLVGH